MCLVTASDMKCLLSCFSHVSVLDFPYSIIVLGHSFDLDSVSGSEEHSRRSASPEEDLLTGTMAEESQLLSVKNGVDWSTRIKQAQAQAHAQEVHD